MATPSPVDFAPLLRLLLLAGVVALLPLGWWWLRQRGADTRGRLAALTALTLFLTFDLVVFGSFTRLTDSGLGCPDWPGCYATATPLGAKAHIDAAEAARPDGPVTHAKAWIEMIHRYLAMTVGALIVVLVTTSWLGARAGGGKVGTEVAAARLPISPWWPTATLVWVIVQGLFGKYTVTLKLYPAIVTLHLLGGLALLALLMAQHEGYRQRPLSLAPGRRRLALAVFALLWVQIALGGWVSTNYAVLACSDFPRCNGAWWPEMDFGAGFTVLRELGRSGDGGFLGLPAMVAIQMVHRLGAAAVFVLLLVLARGLRREADTAARFYGTLLALLALAQVVSGLSNVVLGWPLAAALGHSAGAAALVAVMTSLVARAFRASVSGAAPAVAATRAGPGQPPTTAAPALEA
jgi:cytochrome c oxidase assembly protein subunit 15